MGNEMTGSQMVLESLRRLGCEVIFGLPGGAIIPIYDSLLDAGIKSVLVRHEQGATHMADGFARASGKVGVALVTSGPGATNTVTGISTAIMDSIPIVVITGQVPTDMIGKDAFQECDITGITMPIVKHSYLLKNAEEVALTFKQAFHLAITGRPGPVVIDVPKDISNAKAEFTWPDDLELPHYNPPTTGDPDKIEEAADLIAKAKRPIIYLGGGCITSGAHEEIMEFAQKIQAPVTNTLLGKGAFPEQHELSVGMLGMHGTAYANKSMMETDLMICIGARWDDRITGKLEEFGIEAKKIHIDIDPTEFGKVVQPDVSILGDARHVVRQLNEIVKEADTGEWLDTIDEWKENYPLRIPPSDGLTAQHVLHQLYEVTGGQDIITTDVGQHQMWCAQFYRTSKPRQWLSSGGAGTMGYGFPAAIGAQFAQPDESVWAVVGDGGFQMTFSEMSTAVVHKLPVKVVLINNNYLGMVRQWQDLFYTKRYSGVDLDGNPDFVKFAECYGARGIRITKQEEVVPAIEEAAEITDGPVILDFMVEKEDNVYPMIPAGAALTDMIVGPAEGQPVKAPTGRNKRTDAASVQRVEAGELNESKV